MKLTKAQERALSKLTPTLQSAFFLEESLPTLNALVRKGLAIHDVTTLGSMFSPRTAHLYALKESDE